MDPYLGRGLIFMLPTLDNQPEATNFFKLRTSRFHLSTEKQEVSQTSHQSLG